MTAGQALERAEELRPGSRIALATRQAWLREADAMLRERFFKHSITDAYNDVGADLAWNDSLQDEDVLLAPAPFDAMYPHYLCAMTLPFFRLLCGVFRCRDAGGGQLVLHLAVLQHFGHFGRHFHLHAAADLIVHTVHAHEQVALVLPAVRKQPDRLSLFLCF